MRIEKQNIGPHGKTAVYRLVTDNGEIAATFQTMEEAALVLRYINGGNMSRAEQDQARETLKKGGHRKTGTR